MVVKKHAGDGLMIINYSIIRRILVGILFKSYWDRVTSELKVHVKVKSEDQV